MTPEKEKLLREKYPYLYSECREISCEDGWFDLLDRLSAKIDNETRAVQVKEKFGALRFYVTTDDDEIRSAIREAEEESSRTCEVCGAPGKYSGKSWIRVLCPTHEEEHAKRKTEKQK